MSIPGSPRSRSLSPVHYYPPVEHIYGSDYPPVEYAHMPPPTARYTSPIPDTRTAHPEPRPSERSMRTDQEVRFSEHSDRLPRTVTRRSSEPGPASPATQRHMAVESSIQQLAQQIGALYIGMLYRCVIYRCVTYRCTACNLRVSNTAS
jgi:hypothetical protein